MTQQSSTVIPFPARIALGGVRRQMESKQASPMPTGRLTPREEFHVRELQTCVAHCARAERHIINTAFGVEREAEISAAKEEAKALLLHLISLDGCRGADALIYRMLANQPGRA